MRYSIAINYLGKLILIILIVVALILFFINAFYNNSSTLNQTGSSIINNLSDKVGSTNVIQ